MNNGNSKSNNNVLNSVIITILLIIILLFLLKGCNVFKFNNKGIKIISIKQRVDSFDDDEIFVSNLKMNKNYNFDVTIHNYTDEAYYLYKVEVNNKNIKYNNLLKLLKPGKDTNVKLNIKSIKNLKKSIKIKFYYGKLKEIYIGDDTLSTFGDDKIKMPNGPEKEGYKFLGYTDKEGSNKVKYKAGEEYYFNDGTRLYPIYEEIKDNPDTGNKTEPSDNTNNNTDNKKEEKAKYTITFDYQNGTPSTTKEVTNTEIYGTLPTAVKTGYYFIGWYLGNQKITSESIVDLTSNVILKARYSIINYNISYDLDGGSTDNPSTYTVESNDITLTDAQKDGYEFVGWTGSNGDTPEKNITIAKGSTGNKSYTANYSDHEEVEYKVIHKQQQLDNTYTVVKEETFSAPYGARVKPSVKTYIGFVSPTPEEIIVKQDGTSKVEYKYDREKYTFTLNDSEDVISSLPSGSYPYETEVELTAKDKEGYDFSSWSNGETDKTITITITGNTTIKPIYTPKTYEVVFNANGSEGEMPNQTFNYDEEKALSKNTFTKLGHKFIGWNKKADGTGSTYADEQIVKNLTTSGTVSLFAQFIPETYTISFNTDGGDELFSIERTYGDTYGDLPTPNKPGYTFTGWFNGDQKIERDTVVDITSNVTLKARYNIITYTITYNLDGGTATNPGTYTVEDNITLNNPTKTGYTFSGWTGSNGDSLQTQVTISKGSTGNKTYTAHYSTNTDTKYVVKHYKQKLTLDGYDLEETEVLYGASDTKVTPATKNYTGFKSPVAQEITIKADGTAELEYNYKREIYTYNVVDSETMTSSLPSGDYPYGTEVTVTANTKTGYTFDSWSNGADTNPATITIDSDLNITPIYNPNTYYVIFNNNTGTGSMADQSMTYDSDEVLNKATFTKQGYTFDGWNTKDDGTGTSYDDEATVKNLSTSGNIILFAKWKANTNTEYKVITRKQNLDLETYTETINTYTGTTDTNVTPEVVNYTGFVSPNPQTVKITGDGQASVTYTYNRVMCEFNIQDSEDVISSLEPGNYPYGTEVVITAKDKDGYTFTGWSDGVIDNPRTITIDDDITIAPTYTANTNTSYTVKHYKQKVTLDGYDLEETDNLTGTTDTEVTPSTKTYTGFTSPETQTVTIKGDGTTEVIYNYNRKMYAFDLPDSENVTTSHQPGNYPYGTEITITANDIPGYTFTEWSDGNTYNPRIISLSEDISLTPSYEANTNTAYTVKHYKQKVTLDGYDLADTDNLTGTTNEEVTPATKTYTGFTSPETQTVTIKGDGTTEVTYNYTRKTYTYTVIDSTNMTSSLPSGDYPYGTEVTVTANTVPGYTFSGWNDGNSDNPRTITIDKNISIEPTYTSNTNTSYTVKHYKQNVSLDGYDLAETDNLTGTTNTKVTPNVKTYTGFDSPVPTEVTIKGDGTTVVTYNYTRKSYTFTLNDSEDVTSSHASGSYPYETQITLTANAKPGYTFIGWSNGNTNQTITVSLTDNIEISPVYSNNTDTAYTVIHKQMNIDGEGYTTYETELLHGTTGSKVTPSVKTYTGFTSPSPEEITIKADGSSTLTYKYSRNKYDFAVSDRTYIDEDHSTKNGKYYYQTEISVTATNRTGYTFAGWSNGDNTLTTTFNLDDDTTITPSYTANKYNVVFNSNTGSGSMSDQEMTYDKKANLTKNTFEKTGYLFAGWNIKPDGTGATYEDEAEVKNLATSGNVILYAQWVANPNTPYKVIHRKQNLDMESYTDIEENYTAATNQVITPEVHTYTGFVSPQAQTTTVSADGTTVVTYVYNRAMYTFTLNDKNDVVSSHEDGSYPYETVITLRAKTKEGYTFIKWSDDVTTNPRELTLTGNTTISPIYSEEAEIKYTVIHRKQNLDMETYTDIEEEYQGAAGAEVTPAVKSYTGFNSPEPETVTINADGSTVVTYVYTRKMYDFTISDTTDVTSSHVSGEYPYETEITLTANTKPGYTFIDWSTGETSNPLIITLSSDVEIYPIYSANTDTEYKVIHRKQNLTLDGYDIEEEITNQGTTDTEVTPSVKSYTGFTSPSTQTVTINGDGSTVVTYDYNRISYTLTYEDSTYIDSDRSTPAGSYPYGTLLNIKAVDRAGYTFDGWSNGQSSDPLVIELSNNVSIKPLYVANTNTYYKIIHRKQNLNLITYTDEIEERFGTTDTEVTPNVITYEGFDSPQTQTTTISGDGSTTIIYEYTRKMYTLSFNNNENVITSTPAGSYPYDTEITVKAAKRVGNQFIEWNNGIEDVTYTFRITRNTTIYPIYVSNKYTVSFNENGGTGYMPDQVIYKNEKTRLSANLYTRNNYNFSGWNTKADGSGINYTDCAEIEEEEDLLLYAQWISSDKVARIGNTYYTKLATAISNVPTTGVETEVVLLKDTAEKIEIANTKNVVLNLQNNTLSNNGNLNVIVNDGKLKLINGTITTDVAQGAINNNSTGTMVIDGTHIIVSKTTSKQAIYNDGGNLTINGDTYLSSESNIRATLHNLNNGTITINSGTIISTEIYAIYNEKGSLTIGEKDGKISDTNPEIRGYSYGVVANSKFDFYDGIIEGRSYHIGKTSNTGNTPSISNDTDETKINEIESDSTKITGTKSINNTTYKTLTLSTSDTPEPTPHGPVIYTIKFDAQGGHTSELKRKVEKNTEIGELPSVSREGYITKGWFTEKTGGEQITAETVISRSTTYYAQYISTIDQAVFSPIRIAMHIGDSKTISRTSPTEIEEYTFESNNENIATVTSAGRVTGVGEGITTITITGKTSGITKTIDVEIIPPVKYRVKFNANGGIATEEERFIKEGSRIGELPDATKEDLILDGWYTGLIDGYRINDSFIVNNDIELFAKYKTKESMFIEGKEFNIKIKKLAGNEMPETFPYNKEDSNIISITRSSTAPDISQMTEDNIVSTEDSKSVIYAWYDQGSIYWWSESEEVYYNPDSSYMYYNLKGLEELDLENINSSRTAIMSYMFGNLKKLDSINFDLLDTSSVTDMSYMFIYSEFDELDITKLDTSNVINMSGMFISTKVPSLDFSESDLRNVENMTNMFNSAEISSIDFSNVETYSLTNVTSMFVNTKIKELDLSDFDTSKVSQMSSIFGGTSELKKLDMSNWDFSSMTSLNYLFSTGMTGLEEIKLENVNTSTITSVTGLFSGSSSLISVDLSDFDTSNITDFSGMFGGCTNLSRLNMSNWDFSSCTSSSGLVNYLSLTSSVNLREFILDYSILPQNMTNGFYNLIKLEQLSLNNVDTSNVTNMQYMFYSLNNVLELDLSSFDTSNVTNMQYMFYDLYNIKELDLRSFDTSKVTSMTYMFYNMYDLETIYASDSFVTDNVTSSVIFTNLGNLVGGMGTKYYPSNTGKEFAVIDEGEDNPGYFTDIVPSKYTITFDANGGTPTTTRKINVGSEIGILPSVTNGNKIFLGWYTGLTDGIEIDTFVTPNSNVTYYAHWGESITEFDKGLIVNQKFKRLSGSTYATYTSPNTNIVNIARSNVQPDITNFGENNIVSSHNSKKPIYAWFDNGTIYWWTESEDVYLNKDSFGLFLYLSGLQNLNESDYKANQVEDMSYMFTDDTSLVNLDLSTWNTKNVIDMSYMFGECNKLETLDVSGFDTRNVRNLYMTFYGCSSLTSLNLENFDTRNVRNLYMTFYGCSSLTSLNVTSFDTRNVSDMYLTFYGLTNLKKLDLSSFNTSKVVNMTQIFGSCPNLEELNIKNFDFSMQPNAQFYNIGSGSTQKLAKIDASNVKFGRSMEQQFYGLTALEEIDLSNADTSSVTSMKFTFEGCSSLTELDLSSFDTSNVTTMYGMFDACTNLSELDISSFNTSNLTDMTIMFSGCNALESLDLSHFDISKVTNMSSMFYGCTNLKTVNLSNWNFNINTSSILPSASMPSTIKTLIMDNVKFNTSMAYTFGGLSSLEQISLNNVDTSNVTNMSSMFNGCSSIRSLDLRSLDTKKTTNMSYMFYNMTSLESITVSDDFVTNNVTASDDMFYNDTSLVGGSGTVFDSNHIDKEYARYDGGTSKPGYFNSFDYSGKYEIIYDNDGNLFSRYVTAGDRIGSFPEVEKEGYTLDGWYLNNVKITEDYVPISNIVLEARYTINEYTVTFDSQGGSEINPITKDYNEEIGDLPIPQMAGYRLAGWYDSIDFTTEITPSKRITNDMTLYAKWVEVNSSSVIYNANEGTFSSGNTRTINYEYPEEGLIRKVVHTPNIDDNGIASSVYSNNYSNNKVVKIEGAKKLHIELWFSIEDTNYDWLAIYPSGITPNRSNYSSATISGGKLGNHGNYSGYTKPDDKDETYHKIIDVDGDTAQFYFTSDNTNGFYGYYAIVTGITYTSDIPYEIPQANNKFFVGWNTKQDGTGDPYLDEIDILSNISSISEQTLYAQYIDGYSTFIDGRSLNIKMKKLSGYSNPSYSTSNSNIYNFVRSNTLPNMEFTDDNIVSTPDSISPIYMWYENNTIKYYVNSDKVYLNSDSSLTFYCMGRLENIDLTGVSTSKVINLSSFFYYCQSLHSIDMSVFDTSNVVNMSYMFGRCSGLETIDLSSLDLSKVENISSMFADCTSLTTVNMNNLNMPNLVDMSYMFERCTSLEILNINIKNTLKLSDMQWMFYYCSSLKILDLSSINTSNVTTMLQMFDNCNSLEKIDISSFDVRKVTNMSDMFRNCSSLTEIDMFHFKTESLVGMSSMFQGCTNLVEVDLSNFDTSNVTSMSGLFQGCTSLKEVDLSSFNTSKVINMYSMFQNCSSLTEIDLSNFNTSKATSMYNMFQGCTNLTEIDLSKFNTSNVTSMSNMFANCTSMQEIDITGFSTTKLTNANGMFANCIDLRTIYSSASITFNAVTSANDMFTSDDLLVGGRGTAYSSENVDKEYAHLDNGATNPGYFSQRMGIIITFDPNGGTVTPEMKNINTGAAIGNLPTPSREGATFEGWYDDLEYTNKITTSTKFYDDATLYAKWNVRKYTVTFNPQGGTDVESRTREHGSYIGELPTTTYGNKNFVGWFTADNDYVHEETKVKSDITYYAKWSDNIEDSITYNGNGGLIDQEEENTINYTLIQKGLKKVSHTSNINDSGVASSVYSDNLSVNDVVTIPFATRIRIEVWFSTQASSYDWLAIYPKGVTPTSNNYSSATISNGRLGGHGTYGGYTQPKDSDSTYHKVYYVNGDTAQFFFRSDSSSSFYGYYAVVTGVETAIERSNSYSDPIYKYRDFIGWNTKQDGTGESYLDEYSVIKDFDSLKGKTLYAQWIVAESTFDTYIKFRDSMNLLTNNNTNLIKHLTRSETKPDLSSISKTAIISTPESISPIYSWFIEDTVYWYSNAEHPQLNADCRYMFSFGSYQTIDLSTVKSDYVTDMSGMFDYLSNLVSLDISSFTNQNVTKMGSMFYGDSKLENINFGTFDTPNVTSMYQMFQGCTSLSSLDLSTFDTSNVVSMSYMFSGCTSLTNINISNWSTGLDSDMSYMFSGCTSLKNVNISNIDVSKAINMQWMFYNCNLLEHIDLSTFNPQNVTNMQSMFRNCTSLEYVDLSSFNTKNVEKMANMFTGCSSLKTIDGSVLELDSVTDMSQMFLDCSSLENFNVLLINAKELLDISSMFRNCTSLLEMNLEFLNSHKLKYADSLFYNCQKIKTIKASSLYLDNSTSSSNYLFNNCYSLEYLDISNLNLEHAYPHLDDSSDTLRKIIANNVKFRSGTYQNVFNGLSKLEYIELNNVDTSNATSTAGLFSGDSSLKYIYMDNFDTSNITNMNAMFSGCSSLTEIDLSNFDTRNVTNMSSMFRDCSSLKYIDLTSFDTTNVTNMTYMFYQCGAKVIDIYSFDTTYVTNMKYMFANCPNLITIYASTKWDTTLAASKNSLDTILRGSSNLVGKYGTTWSILNISSYVENDGPFARLDGSSRGFLTEKNGWTLINRAYLGIPIKPSEFLDEQQWSYFEDGVPIHSGFRMLNNLKNVEQKFYFENDIAHTGWLDYEGDMYYFSKSDENNNGYTDSWAYRSVTKTIDGKSYTFDSEGRVVNYSRDTYTITFDSNGGTPSSFTKTVIKGERIGDLPITQRTGKKLNGWFTGIDTGTKITEDTIPDGDLTYVAHWTDDYAILDTGINLNVKFKKLARNTSVSYTKQDKLIYYFTRSKTRPDFDFTEKNLISSPNSPVKIYAWYKNHTIYWWSDSDKIKLNEDSSYMFNEFYNIKEIDTKDIDTSSAINMSYMFYNCYNLEVLNTSGFDTSSATNMSYMFYYNYNLTELDVSGFNTRNVTNMSYMFYACHELTILDVSNFKTSNVTNMSYMFYLCVGITSLDVDEFDTSQVTNMAYMFSDCSKVTDLDISNFNTSKVTNMSFMFDSVGTPNLNFSRWDTSKVTNMSGMFAYYKFELDLSPFVTDNVTTMAGMFTYYGYESLDLSMFNTSKVENMAYMFENCKATFIDYSSFNTSKVTTMSEMFRDCSLPSIDVRHFDTNRVTNMYGMFYGTKITNLDLSNFDTRRVTRMDYMFYRCSSLLRLDLTNFNSNSLSNTEYMFAGCSSMNEILFSNNFTAFSVTKMNSMFSGCSSLTTLDLSMFNTYYVTEMSSMFYYCTSLKSIDISGFYTARVTTFSSMFSNCQSLTSLNVSNFNTGNANYMGNMFANCENIKTLDISSFRTSKVKGMSGMFSGMSSLTTIYVSTDFTTSAVIDGSKMFTDCINLVGEQGTVFDSAKTNKDYAHIDGGTSNPGYFSQLSSAVTITFNANGGTGKMPNQRFSSNKDTLLYKNQFTKKYQELESWNTEPDGSGTSYPDEGLIPANTFTTDTILYAQWRLNGWVLINEDQVQPPEDHLEEQLWSYYDHGELIDDGLFILKNFYDEDKIYYIQNGVAQLGWHKVEGNWYYFSKVDTDGNTYVNCDAYENGKYKIGNDTYTFDENGVCLDYAESPSTTYRIILDSNGGGSVRNLIVNRGSGLTNIPTPPAPVGKTFAGWYTGLTDGVKVEEGYVPSGNITIFARYNDIDYEVSFDSNGGSSVSSRYKHYGEQVGSLPTATKQGYNFVGWYTDNTFATEVTSSTKVIDGVTFYARWSKVISNSCSENQNITTASGTICKRAKTLHQEECQNPNTYRYYCSSSGFTPEKSNESFTVTYGNCGESGVLNVGDAFDCDVNGDGTFDSQKERFYYVSNYYDTNKEKTDYTTATLIYYSNYADGQPTNAVLYPFGRYNVITKLPTTSNWSNVSLKNTVRKTVNSAGSSRVSNVDNVSVDYTGHSARLLTQKEYLDNCDGFYYSINSKCLFFAENSTFTTLNNSSNGFWFEGYSNNGNYYYSGYDLSYVDNSYTNRGVRPAIDVDKKKIAYGAEYIDVIYDANGGTGTTDSQNMNKHEEFTLSKSGFSRKNHRFNGWNTSRDGTGTSYTDEQLVEGNTFTGNTTLYAQWVKIGWEFENESTWDSSQPLTDQKWAYYQEGTKITNGLVNIKSFDSDNKYDYYIKDGYLYYGWIQINENWYFFSWFDKDESGHIDGYMLRDETVEIDGVDYTFDTYGVCQNPPSETDLTDSVESPEEVNPLDDSMNIDSSNEEPDIVPESSDGNVIIPEQDPESPDSNSNVGSSVFGLLYKYEENHRSIVSILLIALSVLGLLFSIYKLTKRKREN